MLIKESIIQRGQDIQHNKTKRSTRKHFERIEKRSLGQNDYEKWNPLSRRIRVLRLALHSNLQITHSPRPLQMSPYKTATVFANTYLTVHSFTGRVIVANNGLAPIHLKTAHYSLHDWVLKIRGHLYSINCGIYGAFLAHHGENLGTGPSISVPGPRNNELLLRIKQTVLNSTLKKPSGYSWVCTGKRVPQQRAKKLGQVFYFQAQGSCYWTETFCCLSNWRSQIHP